MVSRYLTLTLALSMACSSASGTVLHRPSPDGTLPLSDAAIDAGDARDASENGNDAGPSQPGSVGVCRLSSEERFLDQFDGNQLSSELWLVTHGNLPIANERSTGGFVRDNVLVRDRKLVLRVHGDAYTGSVRGIDVNGQPRATGARTGAAIATRDLYMSATYQWEGRLAAPDGVKLVLLVTRDDPTDGLIAITAPGKDALGNASYAFASAQVEGPLAAAVTQQIALPAPLDDGEVHRLRFDWHAGSGPTSLPDIDFWADAENLQTVAGNAPARAARAMLVAFVPDGVAADFDTFELEIQTAFITPFGEVRDMCSDGELTGPLLETPR